MMRWTSLLAGLLLLVGACGSGTDRLEELIASEPSLEGLDRQLRWTVAAATDIGVPPAGSALEEEQRAWREDLARCLDEEDPALCVGEAHRERLAVLQERFALDPRTVALHAAGAEGYAFRGLGNEPGWSLLLADDRAVWETDYGQVRHVIDGFEIERTEGGAVYRTRLEGAPLVIRVDEEPCADDMSGERFDWSVVIEHGDRRWRGCADRTTPR